MQITRVTVTHGVEQIWQRSGEGEQAENDLAADCDGDLVGRGDKSAKIEIVAARATMQ